MSLARSEVTLRSASAEGLAFHQQVVVEVGIAWRRCSRSLRKFVRRGLVGIWPEEEGDALALLGRMVMEREVGHQRSKAQRLDVLPRVGWPGRGEIASN